MHFKISFYFVGQNEDIKIKRDNSKICSLFNKMYSVSLNVIEILPRCAMYIISARTIVGTIILPFFMVPSNALSALLPSLLSA